MGFEVRTISAFEKDFRKLSKKYPSLKSDLFKLIQQLEVNPFLATPLGKDFYKVRVSISSKGKGKSGGCKNHLLCKSYSKYCLSLSYLR